nr:hypothetical protein [Tanacetum cinerariifolium]
SFFIIAVQTPGSGISILLAVGSPFFWEWEHPPLAVGTYTASRNSLLAVGMPCAFYSQQSLGDSGTSLMGKVVLSLLESDMMTNGVNTSAHGVVMIQGFM